MGDDQHAARDGGAAEGDPGEDAERDGGAVTVAPGHDATGCGDPQGQQDHRPAHRGCSGAGPFGPPGEGEQGESEQDAHDRHPRHPSQPPPEENALEKGGDDHVDGDHRLGDEEG